MLNLSNGYSQNIFDYWTTNLSITDFKKENMKQSSININGFLQLDFSRVVFVIKLENSSPLWPKIS